MRSIRRKVPKVRRNVQVLSIILSGVVQSGCAAIHPGAESAFKIKGTILTDGLQSAEPCVLELYRKKGNLLVKTVGLPTKFETSVVIAPGEHEYYMIFRCLGHTAHFKTRVYRLGRTYYFENPIDLGVIDIRDEAPVSR
jgi:hypothetical protein